MQDLLEYLKQQIRQSDNWLQRTQYRRDLIKALINSYPAGAPIKTREMSTLLGYRPGVSSLFSFLANMLKRGEISRRKVSGSQSYSYMVLKPGNTYDKERSQPGQEAQVTEVAVDKQINLVEKGEYIMEKTYTFEELEALAMKYQFYNLGMEMTVAHFLAKLKEV